MLLVTEMRPLRCAIDSLVAALDPAIVLPGGGLGKVAHESLATAPSESSRSQRPVRPAALGDDAGMIGVAPWARQRHAETGDDRLAGSPR